MTQTDFIDKFRHEIGGMILDAVTPRDGAHLAMFARQILKKVDAKLSEMWNSMNPAKPQGKANALAG